MTLKQVGINAAIVIGTLALAFVLYEFREALILFIFSLAIAAAARPYVESMRSHNIPGAVAIVLVYLLFAIFLGLIFWAVGSSLVYELQKLSDSLAMTYDHIWATWPKGTQVEQLIVSRLPPPDELYKSFSPQRAGTMLNGILGITVTSVNLSGQIFTVLIMSIYWSIDRVHFERLWLSLLPVESRARSRDMWRAIERDFGSYVRSQLLQSIIAGLLLGAGLWAMGMPYPTLLALFAALAWLIPWLGGVLAVIPVAMVGFSHGIGLGIFASVYAIGIMFFLDFLIEPRFTHRRQFSSLLSILLIIALVEPFGLMGFIVAPPLAAAIELIFRYNLQTRPLPVTAQSSEQITELQARMVHVREVAARSGKPLEPQTLSILARLEDLIHKADQMIDH